MLTQLKANCGDCKRLGTSKCATHTSYEYIESEQFFICDATELDNDQPVSVVAADKFYQLTVNNDSGAGIFLVKTDKCLFTDEVSKCDCILFNDKKCFFVEIKTSSPGGRGNKRQKAVVQLATTIELIINSGIDLAPLELKAIICFKRNDIYPVRASFNTQRAAFMEKYGVSLDEGNLLSF